VALDAEARTATLADGRRVRYEALVTTAPLDCTLRLLGRAAWADALTHRRGAPLGRVGAPCPRPHMLGCSTQYRRSRFCRGGARCERCSTVPSALWCAGSGVGWLDAPLRGRVSACRLSGTGRNHVRCECDTA